MAKISSPQELFVHKLGAALTMEKTTLEMLEELQREAHDSTLQQNLKKHHRETQQQIQNLEQVFSALGQSPSEEPCPTIDGLQKEGKQNIKEVEDHLVDYVILGGVVETEAHEAAVYDGLISSAETFGEDDIVALLQENLEQEQNVLQQARREKKRVAQSKLARV